MVILPVKPLVQMAAQVAEGGHPDQLALFIPEEAETLHQHRHRKEITEVLDREVRRNLAEAAAEGRLQMVVTEPQQPAALAATEPPHLFPAHRLLMLAAVALEETEALQMEALAAAATAEILLTAAAEQSTAVVAAVAVFLQAQQAAPASSSSSTHWVLLRS